MSENEEDVQAVGEEVDLVPSNKLASQTAAELEDELARFRNEWKMELLQEQDTKDKLPGTEQSTKVNVSIARRGKNVAEYHSFPVRAGAKNNKSAANESTSETTVAGSDLNYVQPRTNEEKAKYLFDKAVLLEQQGRHYEAIKFYRMSMQLDADIEFKIASNKAAAVAAATGRKKKSRSKKNSHTRATSDDDESESDNDEQADNNPQSNSAKVNENQEEDLRSLYERFHDLTISESKICEKNQPQKSTHVSQLPLEVIMIILKWVVSDHLDMRSLDNFAAVCKGFYVLGRDPEIWKLACAKIWGEKNTNNYLSNYSSWREMFLQRPRLNFDGVYISKSSYARAGEQSLDNFYRPWHLVEYYRYLRFFSDGTVLFLTSPDEPKTIVSKLKIHNTAANGTTGVLTTPATSFHQAFIMNEQCILKGTWTLALKTVSIVLIKRILKSQLHSKTNKRTNKEPILEQEHIFRLELELNGKMNNQLHWVNYDIDVVNKLTNTINVTKFDLNKIDFPNFYYSRVKSYSNNCEKPLK